MAGTFIAMVKYMDGHSSLGLQTIKVNLISYATNLTVESSGVHTPLFSIPWANLSGVRRGTLEKKGLDSVGSSLANLIPGLDITSFGDPYRKGIWITFWDEELQRDQDVFFATTGDDKSDKIKRQIYEHRDTHYRAINKHSSIGRRP